MHTIQKAFSLMTAVVLAIGAPLYAAMPAQARAVDEAKLEASDADVEAARQAVAEAEQKLASLQAQVSSGSLGFFESRGSTDAVKAIRECTYNSYTKEGDSADATSIENMRKALDWIGTGNNLRTSVGLGVLDVSDLMMACAQADTNYSDVIIGHAQQFGVWENLAWNYGSDPYVQWYDQEKVIFDAAYTERTGSSNVPTGAAAYNWYQDNQDAVDYSDVGHYLNIITPQLTVTGFGVVTRGTNYGWITHGQVAHVSGGSDPSGKAYSLNDYKAAFEAYCANLDGAVKQAESDLAAAREYLASISSQELSLADATIAALDPQPYTGSAVTPKPEVKIGSLTLVEDRDYTLSYQDNVELGTATMTITGKGRVSGTRTLTFEVVDEFEMFRLYNPHSGEHFYTASVAERDAIVAAGWKNEGIGWIAPVSGDPVYRLYNANAGDHHYTKDASERDSLVAMGWKDEGIGWYSDASQTVPLYREYNPNAQTGTHNYTTSEAEHDQLVKMGWKDEGVAWHALRAAK